MKEGWEPLCEFLGVEAPKDKLFPYLNDAATFRKMFRWCFMIAFAGLIGGALLAGLASLYLVIFLRHRSDHRESL